MSNCPTSHIGRSPATSSAQRVEPQHESSAARLLEGDMRFNFSIGPSRSLKSGIYRDAPVESQSADAAVRVDVETHVRRSARVLQLILVEVSRVRLQWRARQKLAPRQTFECRVVHTVRGRDGRFERAAFGEVPTKVRGVNFDPPDAARRAEAYDAPVVSGPAASLRLPPVAHVEAATGHDEVVPVSEELIARRNDQPAVLDRRQINKSACAHDSLPVGHDLAVDAQTRDTAVRVNLEAKMREPLV